MEADFAVIFDLDGLLVDSEPLQAESFNIALAPHGIKLADEFFRQLVGIATSQNFKDIRDQFGISESVDDLLQRKNRAYKELIRTRLRPRPGARHLVEQLWELHVPMAVASSSVRPDVLASLQAVNLTQYMLHVVTADDVAHAKPAPDLYIEAARRLNYNPCNCIALEDAEPGVHAATTAGINCIACPNCYTDHLAFVEACKVVRSLEELTPEILKSHTRALFR